jgi:hypothetical protein
MAGNRRRTAAIALMLGWLVVAGCSGGDDDDDERAASDRADCPALEEALPGLSAAESPWPPELDHLGERLDEIGLPRLTQEGTALDLHVQLSIEIDGADVEVPTSIGLDGEEVAGGRMVTGFVSAIHTHDDSGLVHVHSPDERRYTLGQLFAVWGVALTEDRIGGYCVGGGRTLTVEAGGDEVSGDPRDLELQDGLRITITYGDE